MPEKIANNVTTTLTAGVNNVTTTLPVAAAAPTALQNGEFRIIVDSEIMKVTAGQGTTSWTVERQVEGTSSATHASGATVKHILTAYSLRLLREELWMTDPRIGIEMNRTGVDQGPKIQQWLDLLQTSIDSLAVGRIPPGVVENRSIPDLFFAHNDRELLIAGCGNGNNELSGSVIRFPVDFGAGFYAIKPAEGGAYPINWRDFTLLGPGGGAAYGSDQAAMYGPRIAGASKLSRVTITRFKTGAFAPGDHHEFHECNFSGNSYAMYFANNGSWGIGDVWCDGCYLIGCSKASIGIGTSYTLANFTFRHGHGGFSPMGIHRFEESGEAVHTSTFLLGGKFDMFGFEACGDAVIYDEASGGKMQNVEFTYQGESGTDSSLHWPGKNPLGNWHVGDAIRCSVADDVSPTTYAVTGAGRPWIYATGEVADVHARGADYAAANVYAGVGPGSAFHDLVTCPKIGKVTLGLPGASVRGVNATVVNVQENVSRYDALELVEWGGAAGTTSARKARNAYPYLGQALHDATSGSSVYVVTNGFVSNYVRAKVTSGAASGDKLKVDPVNPGSLTVTTGFGYDVVARAQVTIGANAIEQVTVTHSQAS